MLKLEPKQELRILDFDIENRPLSYLGMDFTTAEVTAIACAFTDKPELVYTWALGEDTLEDMLLGFKTFYDAADIVTGHYVLRHDLPILNHALFEAGLGKLGQKLVSDTKMHLMSGKGISKSQESLGAMLDITAPKIVMTQDDWREGNRLTPKGIALTKKRVSGDVVQHMQMRAALIERGALKPPEVWKP